MFDDKRSGHRLARLSVWRSLGGETNNSATNYPLVQIQRLDNEQRLWLLHPASATAFASLPVTNILPFRPSLPYL